MSSVSIRVSHPQLALGSTYLTRASSCHAGGVGLSGPVLKQFTSQDDETNFWSSVMKPGGYEAHGNLTQAKDVGFL